MRINEKKLICCTSGESVEVGISSQSLILLSNLILFTFNSFSSFCFRISLVNWSRFAFRLFWLSMVSGVRVDEVCIYVSILLLWN